MTMLEGFEPLVEKICLGGENEGSVFCARLTELKDDLPVFNAKNGQLYVNKIVEIRFLKECTRPTPVNHQPEDVV